MNPDKRLAHAIQLIQAKDYERAIRAITDARTALSSNAPLPRSNRSKEVVGIFVGHSRIGDRGAVSVDGIAEWTYNRAVCTELMRELHRRDLTVEIFWAYKGNSYGAAMQWLAQEAPKRGVTLGLELHFNSGGGTGHEMLCFNADQQIRSTKFAQCVSTSLAEEWPEGANRGVKSAVRGRPFVSNFEFPAIIVEPFFGDNPNDWARWKDKQSELAAIYANGIVRFLEQDAG